MRIGELAQRSGLSASCIRFYEAKGLLNVGSRSANGYRDYPADALLILGIIVNAQRTGFSLDEIRQMLPADLGNWRHEELMDVLHRKIADIEQMQRQLAESKKQLHVLIRTIEDRPNGIDCAGNTRRVLKQIVAGGSRPVSRRPSKHRVGMVLAGK